MWNKTNITSLLGIEYPIILGPMGGGFSTPELVAAVSNAGGLGSLGAYTLSPESILEAAQSIEAKTGKPYNINLWVSDVDDRLNSLSLEEIDKVRSIFQPYFDTLNIRMPELDTNIVSRFEKQAEVVFKIKPAVFSFIFGIPSPEILREARRLGIRTVGAATTLDEALALEDARVDAIVAAGFEAGGHRPSFLRPAGESLTGTFTLIQQLKANVRLPVIAAGGIVVGKGIAAALALGADAVQLGTAFLVTEESNANQLHKNTLSSGVTKDTVLSKSLTGRMGRMLRNHISEHVPNHVPVLPFQLQTRLVASLREAAIAAGRIDMMNFWSGQNNGSLKQTTASQLFQTLISEVEEVIKKGY